MPIYEYKCEMCGYTFEVFTSFSRNGARKCPHCGARARRIISPPGVIFKGSGFYSTDHRSNHGSNGSRSSGKDITPKKEKGSGKEAKSSASTKTADAE